MKSINCLQITIRPAFVEKGYRHLKIKVETAQDVYQKEELVEDNHFEDLFSHIIKRAELEFREIISKKEKE